MELQTRAKFFTKVISVLYSQKGLRGRLTTATRGARFLSLGIRLSDPLGLDAALKLAEPLALAVNCPAVIATRRPDAPGLVSYQFELQQAFWQTYTRADLVSKPGAIGVGLGEARRQIDFSFDPPHALVAGATRIAGKTETVKSILTGLFTTYQPGELGAVICDAHRDYEALDNAAHLLYPLAHAAEDIDEAINYAGQELARRKERNARDAPPFVLAIDEAETELDNAGRLAVVQNIGKEAAKFQMFLIIATQKPKQGNLGDLINNLNHRFVGRVSDAQTSAMLTGRAGLECHKLTPRGDFIHVADSVERLQVALAAPADLAKIPRAEIRRPVVDAEDTPRVLSFPEPKGPGRPANEPEPVAVAHYLWFGDKLSIARAAELLGLSKRAHYLHRDFAREVRAELIRLRGATA